MSYQAATERYERMEYRRCGTSGLLLPAMSLGLWHNFGVELDYEQQKHMLLTAFDRGITHFDLANNYGPVPGSAEISFGRILKKELSSYRDEMIIATKAGYRMWPGPYGEWGSKKSLTASLDQSLKRMQLEYVDIFYHHRPDPQTPLEETVETLVDIVKSGKALYIGISNYNATDTRRAIGLLRQKGVHCLIHQMQYSMINRVNEPVLEVLQEEGVGGIAFSPLAQGILSGKYRNGIPADSRAAGNSIFLKREDITQAVVHLTKGLEKIASDRGQGLPQMALAWVLHTAGMTSVILGASQSGQIIENLKALHNLSFTREELEQIHTLLEEYECEKTV